MRLYVRVAAFAQVSVPAMPSQWREIPEAYIHPILIQQNFTTADCIHYGSDIVFIGTWDKEREKALENVSDLDVGIWGPYWDRISRKSALAAKIRGGFVDVNTMVKIYRSSKIVLNLMRQQNYAAHNMKTFEIPAMGGFMLAPRTKDHIDFFSGGKEIALYDNFEEMREKAIYYIAHDKERNDMLHLFHNRVISNDTYLHRMRQLVKCLEMK